VEPGERVGTVGEAVAKELGIPDGVPVNSGALDHFAGMIGTGNTEEGIVSETTGTVLAIATMTRKAGVTGSGIPCQYNAIRDTFVLMPVCESGGLSLEWFKNNFYPGSDYTQLNSEIKRNLEGKNEVVFLPYLTGTNAPECDVRARGVFYGLNV
jgi:sugar (pentulose or hexulose) kinase